MRDGNYQHALEMSQEEPEPRDQDYRSDTEPVQKPSNVVMLRMLPPNATANEVCQYLYLLTDYIIIYNIITKHLLHTLVS